MITEEEEECLWKRGRTKYPRKRQKRREGGGRCIWRNEERND